MKDDKQIRLEAQKLVDKHKRYSAVILQKELKIGYRLAVQILNELQTDKDNRTKENRL